jgi:thiol-disulfide isomerase/thioredoxin
MKFFLCSLLSLFVTHSCPLFAESKLSLPGTEVMVVTHDGNDLTLYQYPASGGDLVLWIGGNGWHDRTTQLAMDFAEKGIEVWQIDFAEALMQTSSRSFLRNLDARYVADIIDAAHQRTGKRVVLLAQAFGAIPLLQGATLWQQRKNHRGLLLGAILFSPDLATGLPPLGKDPEYLPITRATNIPMMIYQGSLHSSPRQFSQLLAELNKNNPHVFFKMLPGVNSSFYKEETGEASLELLKSLPGKSNDLFRLFESLPARVSPITYEQAEQVPNRRPDIQLNAFHGNPLPPAIDLSDASGKRFRLDEYRGKVTVVNFWASWCPPCVAEIPSLNRLREKMQGQPFELISINYAESTGKIREFMQQVSVEFPVLLDPDGKVSQHWNVIGFPSTFVIGKDGKIHYGVNAAIHWDTPEVVNALKALNQ